MAVEILAFVPGLLLLLLANYAEKRKEYRILTQIFLGLCVMLVALYGLLIASMSGSEALKGYDNAEALGYGVALTGILALPLFLRPVRGAISKAISIDPENWLHATALVFAILLVGISLATALSTDVVKLGKESGIDTSGIISQDAVFALASLIGVGWLVRRDWKKTAERLGLRLPTLKDVGMSLAFLGILLLIMLAGGLADKVVNQRPDSLSLKDDPTIKILGQITVAAAVVLALGAGIGEELLFRGAMQPRFGIALTSLVFALIHVQYLDVISMATLFAVSVVLGYERRIASTAACVITHSLYDLLLFLMVALYV
jgi:membrane protease YdiL (CAAX protease family)